MATTAATSYQVPAAITGALAIAAVDTAMGGRYSVHVWGDWVEPCQLYIVPVCESGTRKSPVFDSMVLDPIMAAERQLKNEREIDAVKSKARVSATAKALVEAERKYAKTSDTGDLANVESAAMRADDAVKGVVEVPQLFTSDATMPILEIEMEKHHGRLAVLGAESPMLANISGLYTGGTAHFDPLLAGHSSDAGQRTARVSRDAVAIDHPSISLCLMIQVAVMTTMIGKPEFIGRGLVQRMLLVLADAQVGYRDTGPDVPSIPTEVRDKYTAMVRGLAYRTYLAEQSEITLSEGAVDVIGKLADIVERGMRPGGRFAGYPLITEWASKYVGAVVRIAAVLHIGGGHQGQEISEATASAAVRVGEFFAGNAVAAFAETQSSPDTLNLRYLLGRVKAMADKREVQARQTSTDGRLDVDKQEAFTASGLACTCSRKGASTRVEVTALLAELEVLGWVRKVPPPPRPAGTRTRLPDALWEAHPGLLSGAYPAR